MLADRIQGLGLRVVRCTGLGSLAGLIEQERVQAICASDTFDEFIRYCERFDIELLPDGPGPRHERVSLPWPNASVAVVVIPQRRR